METYPRKGDAQNPRLRWPLASRRPSLPTLLEQPHSACTTHSTGPNSDECFDFSPNAATAIASNEDDLDFPGAQAITGS